MAFLHWQRAHCPKCGQDRAEWLDKDGKELRDPPYEVVEVLCPSCEMLEDAEAERGDDPARKNQHGRHMAFRWLPDLRDEAASEDAPEG